jgi:enoyl-[acyl-carrier protein] reductase I
MLQVARKLDAIERGGSMLALTFVAAQRVFYGYNDMPMQKHCWNPSTAVSDISLRDKGTVNYHFAVATMTTDGCGVNGMTDG